MFQRVLIANRGEIAVRILRACREIGVDAVTVYSAADADSLHVQLSPNAVCIGPAKAADSYLNVDALLTVAKETGCDAIHPGYGFLSENADFAQRCADLGIAFIGPSGAVIQAMGNKAAARELMQKHNVPVVPGSDGPVETAQDAVEIARKIGYPGAAGLSGAPHHHRGILPPSGQAAQPLSPFPSVHAVGQRYCPQADESEI